MVHQRALGLQSAGERSVSLDRLATTGVYLYRLRVSDPSSGASRGALSGKLMFME